MENEENLQKKINRVKNNLKEIQGFKLLSSSWEDDFDDECLTALSYMIAQNPDQYHNLKAIVIMRSSITDVGIETLFDTIKNNSAICQAIEILNLQWNLNLTDKGLKSIANSIGNMPNLERLYLAKPNGNYTKGGAEYLAEKVHHWEVTYSKNLDADFGEGLKQDIQDAYKEKYEELSSLTPKIKVTNK